MNWHAYAEVLPGSSPGNQSDRTEQLVAECLADLELPDATFQRIRDALVDHFSVEHQPVVRVFVGRTGLTRQSSHDWRFFIVTPGRPAAAGEPNPTVELYLYQEEARR